MQRLAASHVATPLAGAVGAMLLSACQTTPSPGSDIRGTAADATAQRVVGNGPVFGRLRGLRAERDPGSAPSASSAWALSLLPMAQGDPARAAHPDPGVPPTVLSPLLPLPMR